MKLFFYYLASNFLKHLNLYLVKKKNQNNTDLFLSWNFSFTNYMIFLIGIVLIAIGYYVMYIGGTKSFYSITLAPAILVFAYCVVIPFSIMYNDQK